MSFTVGVYSEVGPLQTVIVHRPGVELARLTPSNRADFLFDDLLWIPRAQEEHDRFVASMQQRGVQVLYLRDLLTAALETQDLRAALIAQIATPQECGRHLAETLKEQLVDFPIPELMDVLIGGLLNQELEGILHGHLPTAEMHSDPNDFIIPPIPNLYFMRDNASWIGRGVSLNNPHWPARRRESLIMRHVYRHHPGFAALGFPIWFGEGEDEVWPATLEGGDILVLSKNVLLVGCGERTAPAAVEMLAERLFQGSDIREVLVARFRKARSVMHLDTVLTQVDRNVFNVYPGIFESMQLFSLTQQNGQIHVDTLPVEHIQAELARVLEVDNIRFITGGGDAIHQQREQWDDGSNTFAIAPGVVMAYSRNSATNRKLRDAGLEVIEIDASELPRGRGGSRCMTQPVLRLETA